MRTLTTLAIIFFFGFSYAQGNGLSYSVQEESLQTSDSELYIRAKKWVSKTYSESATQLIGLKESPNESIIGYSSMNFTTKDAQLKTVASGSIDYRFEIKISPGEYELTLTNFTHVPLNPKYDFGVVTTDEECPIKVKMTMKKSRINVWRELKHRIKEDMEPLIASFRETMQKETEGDVAINAQKVLKGIPDDLAESRIIFLKHDSVKVEKPVDNDRIALIRYKNQQMHNSKVQKANTQLLELAKEYPNTYTIAYRKDVDALKASGYKYLLDCLAFENLKKGDFKSNSNFTYMYELFIRDLENNYMYTLKGSVAEMEVYDYKKMMRVLMKNLK